MKNVWDNFFRKEGAAWKFLPSNSALAAVDLFKSEGFVKVLIPGCGYGRNARLFDENGFEVTGIEISGSAISIARENGLKFPVHEGSVTNMPYDGEMYDSVFCYAVLHLLNKPERKKFLKACYNQLKPGGIMIQIVASREMNGFGTGRFLSNSRYQVTPGINVYFYDELSVRNEFRGFGKLTITAVEEPVKFAEGHEPLKMISVICRK
jgi:SAM-dependent methyltransferase